MNITTKTGDKGTTQFENEQISKGDNKIEFIGNIDELQVALGGIKSEDKQIINSIKNIQTKLFDIYSNKITPEDVQNLEELQQALLNTDSIVFDWNLTTPKTFPVDFARVTTRKAERVYSRLNQQDEYVLQYLNRLSDYLWILGRYIESVPKEK